MAMTYGWYKGISLENKGLMWLHNGDQTLKREEDTRIGGMNDAGRPLDYSITSSDGDIIVPSS